LIKVGVVASAKAMRIGLREVLNGLPGLSVVAEATRLEDLAADEADVVVLASPAALDDAVNTQALLLLSDDPQEAQELLNLQLPAWGVLSINASEDELRAAIGALAEGLWVAAPGLLGGLFAQKLALQPFDGDLDVQALTERETEVLQLTAQGLANKQIAMRLGISEHTVKFHLSSLYAKLGVASRTEAVRSGARRGLVVL
jgi:DNA-binding NarL/FixJ family response regulator